MGDTKSVTLELPGLLTDNSVGKGNSCSTSIGIAKETLKGGVLDLLSFRNLLRLVVYSLPGPLIHPES